MGKGALGAAGEAGGGPELALGGGLCYRRGFAEVGPVSQVGSLGVLAADMLAH